MPRRTLRQPVVLVLDREPAWTAEYEYEYRCAEYEYE